VQRMLDCSDLYLHISSNNIVGLNDELCSVFCDRDLLQVFCQPATSINQLLTRLPYARQMPCKGEKTILTDTLAAFSRLSLERVQ
jgi:hypothetical protein